MADAPAPAPAQIEAAAHVIFAKRPAAVIFDMDGVLFNTEALGRDTMLEVAAERGLPLTLEHYLGLVGLPTERCLASLADRLGPDADVAGLWAAWGALFHARAGRGGHLKPGVTALLDWLDARDIPRAIATSSRRTSAERLVAAHGLGGRFRAVLGREDYQRAKPDPEPYLAAARALGVDPVACVAVEDSFHGVRAASAAGMMTVMVPDLLAPTDEIRGLCCAVAPDLDIVLLLLEERWTRS